MTRVLTAATAGFCFGVQRAVARVEELARQHPDRRVITIGPLIHNEDEVARLRSLGIAAVAEQDVRPDDVVVIRSHGATVELLERLRARAQVHDATCPHVSACQRRARRMARAGYGVVLVADPGHPETEAVLSHAAAGAAEARSARPVCAVRSAEELRLQELSGVARVAVLAQTTIDHPALEAVAGACLGRFREVRVLDTICEATARRQGEARALARAADVVVVVGGCASANTRRLVELCAGIQPRTHHVQRADDLRAEWIPPGGSVAVTAGASTPAGALRAVAERLRQMNGDQEQ